MSCGRRGKCETPQAKPRRLAFLPAESKCQERKSTGIIYKQKQQSFRKEAFTKEHQQAVLIGHGFFNRFIAKELQKSGWTGKRRTGSKHWNAVTYMK
jgi:DNA-binding NarL/FixJ family response regulator